jgi:hypothetical protein
MVSNSISGAGPSQHAENSTAGGSLLQFAIPQACGLDGKTVTQYQTAPWNSSMRLPQKRKYNYRFSTPSSATIKRRCQLPDSDAFIFCHFHLEKSTVPAAKARRQKPVVCPAAFGVARQASESGSFACAA